MDSEFKQVIEETEKYLQNQNIIYMNTRRKRCLNVIDNLTKLIGDDNYNELNTEVVDISVSYSKEKSINNMKIVYNNHNYIFNIEFDEMFRYGCRLLISVEYYKEISDVDIFLMDFKRYFNHAYIQILNNYINSSNKELDNTIRLNFHFINKNYYVDNYSEIENEFISCEYVRFNNKKFGNGFFYLCFDDIDNIPLLHFNKIK
jgi:hypothetical protein